MLLHLKIGLIRVTYDPPVSIMVNKYLKSISLFFLSLFSLSFYLVSDLIEKSLTLKIVLVLVAQLNKSFATLGIHY